MYILECVGLGAQVNILTGKASSWTLFQLGNNGSKESWVSKPKSNPQWNPLPSQEAFSIPQISNGTRNKWWLAGGAGQVEVSAIAPHHPPPAGKEIKNNVSS